MAGAFNLRAPNKRAMKLLAAPLPPSATRVRLVLPPLAKRRHQPPPREKAASKVTPAPAAEPVVAAPVTAPPADAATPDANDLARAAIERLRGTEPAPRVQ